MTSPNDSTSFASPPCFANEGAATKKGSVAVDQDAARDVARWRKTERARLIEARQAVSVEDRTRASAAVAEVLDRELPPGPGMIVSLYWPFKGELDLRGWMRRMSEGGATVALPVVVEKARPLHFRVWSPGCKMGRGVWNIPIPDDGEEVTPNVVISPLIGFDDGCYRLGYGGGFFDRTLAGLLSRPRVIGVGMDLCRIPTIYPQPHDIPMDMIVTENGVVERREAR